MNKNIIVLLGMFIFTGYSFAGGLYNLHNISYTYGCYGHDNTSDSCGVGEINLQNRRGTSSRSGYYTCGKIDTIAPNISISGINPERKWVNIDRYNPIKNITIRITDAGAGIRYIKLVIGTKMLEWNFGYSNKKSSFTIRYNDICGKAGLSGINCYKSLFLEGKNNIKIYAYDAVYSYINGSEDPSNSNEGSWSSQIWVDNSRSTYNILGDKAFLANGLGVTNNNFSNKWKNKTLKISSKVKDNYGEGIGLNIETKICSGKPSNSIWVSPSGVNTNNGKFASYNGNPSINECRWECNIGYIKDGTTCIKKEKKLSCKTYFENKGYDLSNIDGNKLYFVLSGGGIIDKKTGYYTGIYSISKKEYIPKLSNCQIKGGITKVEYDVKDQNGNNIKISQDANLLIINSTNISYIPDRGQKSCGNLGNLIDFNNGNGQNNNGNGDIKANFIYRLLSSYGGGYYDAKDHNNNNLVNDKNEFEKWYEIVDHNGIAHYDKDITKVCGDMVCVANSSELDSSNCKCNAGYYPKDSTSDKVGKYSECISLPNNKCLKDTNGDGYEDSIFTLNSNQIIFLRESIYSTDKIPVCGQICGNNSYTKDTDGDGRPDSCAIDGECGINKDTCNKGDYQDVTDTNNYYQWKCLGKYGGNDSSICNLHKSVNGECGINKDTCNKGDYQDVTDTDNYYQWKCLGKYGGNDSEICKKNKNF